MLMNALTKDREGPVAMDEMSMAAIDRCMAEPAYQRNPTLRRVYHDLHSLTPVQVEMIRAARKWADGGYTHLPGEVTRPRNYSEK